MILLPQDTDATTRFRDVLDNGDVVICRKRVEPSVTLCLTMDLGGVPESQRHIGVPHLVEHLMMRGVDDFALESRGGWISARTTRRVMQITCVVAPGDEKRGLDAIFQALNVALPSKELIETEATLIALEAQERPEEVKALDDLKAREGRFDPVGDPLRLATLSPETVAATAKALLLAPKSLVASGPLDPPRFGESLRRRMPPRPRAARARPEETQRLIGSQWDWKPILGIDRPSGQAALGAALAWASANPGGQIVYEPEIGTARLAVRLPRRATNPDVMVARLALQSYFESRTRSPYEWTSAQGALAVMNPGLVWERLAEEGRPTNAQLAEELARWSPPSSR